MSRSPAPWRVTVVEDDHHVEISVPWRRSWKLWGLVGIAALFLGAIPVRIARDADLPAIALIGLVGLVPIGLVVANRTVVTARRDGVVVETRPIPVWPFVSRQEWPRVEVGFLGGRAWSWHRKDVAELLLEDVEPASRPRSWTHLHSVTLERGDGTYETLVWFVDDPETSDWIRGALAKRLDAPVSPSGSP